MLIDGINHKICTGPAHEIPTYLPATEKYFYQHKTGKYAGGLTARCRLCHNWSKVKSPGSHHGYVPVEKAKPFYAEAANRIGVQELANRTGLSRNHISQVLSGKKHRFVQKGRLRQVMLELVSLQRSGEISINREAAWRRDKRLNGSNPTCSNCKAPQRIKTLECKTCWDRFRRWLREGKITQQEHDDGYVVWLDR